jgi:hypothetical protein
LLGTTRLPAYAHGYGMASGTTDDRTESVREVRSQQSEDRGRKTEDGRDYGTTGQRTLRAAPKGFREGKTGVKSKTFDKLEFVRPNVTLGIAWRQINGDLFLL